MSTKAVELSVGVGRRPGGRLATLLLFAGLLGLATGCTTLPVNRVALAGLPPAQSALAEQNLTVFNAVWDLVNRKHFDPDYQGVDWQAAGTEYGARAAFAPDETALYETINEMVGLLHDSHTHAFDPVQAAERRTHLRPRTGFNLTRIEEQWIVSEVLPGTPAEQVGIKVGWIVVARDGEPLGKRLDFRPQEGEKAEWDFIDERGRPVRLAPEARRISGGSRQNVREFEGGFVYLRFDEFGRRNRRWLYRQLKQYAHAPGVVLDLRRNPGGETFSLGITIGEFFDQAVDCGTFISRSGAQRMKTSWQLGSARYRGHVAVLVDRGTGSAAEIFSAVLQDHDRATIVGRRTAGAVLASRFYRLPNGGELQLSREDYVAPNGRRIEGEGVEPDVYVPRLIEDLRAGRDRDLETALRILQEKVAVTRVY